MAFCKSQRKAAKRRGTRQTRRGRPPALSERDERRLLRTVDNVRAANVGFSGRQLLTEAGLAQSASIPTIYRVLRRAHFSFSALKKNGVLTAHDLKARLAFARSNLGRPPSY